MDAASTPDAMAGGIEVEEGRSGLGEREELVKRAARQNALRAPRRPTIRPNVGHSKHLTLPPLPSRFWLSLLTSDPTSRGTMWTIAVSADVLSWRLR